MPKKAAELGPLQVSRLKARGLHPVGGVAGLRLQVSGNRARSWILRIRIGGKDTDAGLGGYPDVTLAGARDSARVMRAKVKAGINPVLEGRQARSALQASVTAAWTFDKCAEACIENKRPGWKNAKHAAQWTATLETYASPVIGRMLVRDVGTPQVIEVLQPIWTTKTETATRVRARIEAVLDWATTGDYRDGPNPARWKGHLEHKLAAPGKVAKVAHHTALPVPAMPAFMCDLRAMAGIGARALEFAILTAARSGEVRGATWSEVDFEARTWTVPAERMKAGVEHIVPLSDPALPLLRAALSAPSEPKPSDLIFTAPRGGQLSDMTLSAVVRRMGTPAVPHGFRSTFRQWAAERTNFPREVAEHALAHQLPDKVEAAYQRSTMVDKRRKLMVEWANFCGRVQTDATVTPIATRRKTTA